MPTARLHVTEERGRYHVRWFADDAQLWRAILVDFRAAFHVHAECHFCTTTRSWSLPLHCRRRLQEWAQDWFDADAQVWDDEPDGAPSGGPPPRGPHASGEGAGRVPATREEALRVLHLLPSAPDELVCAAHKVLVKKVHPDRGGTHAAAVALNRAWEILSGERSGRSA